MRRRSDFEEVFATFASRLAELGATSGLISVPKLNIDKFKRPVTSIKRMHSDNAKEYYSLEKNLE